MFLFVCKQFYLRLFVSSCLSGGAIRPITALPRREIAHKKNLCCNMIQYTQFKSMSYSNQINPLSGFFFLLPCYFHWMLIMSLKLAYNNNSLIAGLTFSRQIWLERRPKKWEKKANSAAGSLYHAVYFVCLFHRL